MPIQFRRAVPRSIAVAATSVLLTASVPQAAFAASEADAPAPIPSGLFEGFVIAAILVTAAGLAVLAQLDRERKLKRARHRGR